MTDNSTMDETTVDSVASLIRNATRIVVLVGAGISTAAGIPDFRSDSTGLYAKLQALKLPYHPETLFDINYFRHSPEPFYAVASARRPRNVKPTVSHAFLALLARRRGENRLLKLFTQNTDGLERAAGVPEEKVLAVHGSWATQRCIACQEPFPDEPMREAIEAAEVPRCRVPGCGGIVKPDIVFYGEALPASFEEEEKKVAEADLVIIMGTSLRVHPFARLPGLAADGVPRVLINLEKAGDLGKRPADVCMLGDCDEVVRKLADALGWREDLEVLWKEAAAAAAVTGREGHDSQSDVAGNLDKAMERLARTMNQSTGISAGHKNMLEKHLETKLAQVVPRTFSDKA